MVDNKLFPNAPAINADPNTLQALAADTEANVFVAASAGTGKTKVLTDRYLRLLLAGNPAPSILCITYTQAAAHEMLARIKKRLKTWFLLDKEAVQADLAKLLQRAPTAAEVQMTQRLYFEFIEQEPQLKIETLHAFCFNLLQKFPPTEKLRSGINIITDEQKDALLELAFNKVISNDAPSAQAAQHLANIYDGRNLRSKLFDLFAPTARLRRYLQAECVEESFASIYAEYQAEAGILPDELTTAVIQTVRTPALDSAIQPLVALEVKNADKLLNWLQLSVNQQSACFEDFYSFFLTKEDVPRHSIVTKKVTDQYPAILPLFTNIAAELAVYRERWKAQTAANYFVALLSIARAMLQEYTQSCQARGLFEYDDLIDECINLLSTSQNAHWILYLLDMKINHVLVDEAQDISPRQWQIISLLTDDFFAGVSARSLNRTVFIVGDYKQSIYGFQGANPDYFAQVCIAYAQKGQDAGKIWREIQLNTSFRSTATVLEFIDNVFNTHKLTLDSNLAPLLHKPFRPGYGIVKVEQSVSIEKADDSAGWMQPEPDMSLADPRQKRIASIIADQLALWLEQKRLLSGHRRPIMPGDILILLRKRGDLQQLLVQELKCRQIPVADADRFPLTSHLLVKDFLALGNFLLLPTDDMNLAILLRSPICGLSEEQLFALAYARQCSLWQRVRELEPATASYLQELMVLTQQSKISIYAIFARVMYEDNKIAHFIAQMGEFAREVAADLAQTILEYEQQQSSDLQQFITWLGNANITLKSTKVTANDAVRVMTIHTAKGLQAPIVIMADAASSEQSPYGNLYWFDDKLYFSVYKEYDTVHVSAAKQKNKEREQQENNRLLYVAMTRAEDELYVYGWSNNRDKNSWHALLYAVLDAAQCSDETPAYGDKAPDAVIDIPPAVPTQHPLPEHFLMPVLNMPSQQVELVRPSSKTAGARINSGNFVRGEVIHKLLFLLPHVPQSAWDAVVAREAKARGLNAQIENINKVVHAVIAKFPELFFAPGVMSEVVVTTQLYGQRITAQIDKLVFTEKIVKIIDFKTDAEVVVERNAVNPDYLRQMGIYRKIIATKYPQYQISSQILWTENQEVTPI